MQRWLHLPFFRLLPFPHSLFLHHSHSFFHCPLTCCFPARLTHSPSNGRVQGRCSFLDTRLWFQAPTPSPNTHTHASLLHNHHNFTATIIRVSAWRHEWNKGKQRHKGEGFIVQDNEAVCILILVIHMGYLGNDQQTKRTVVGKNHSIASILKVAKQSLWYRGTRQPINQEVLDPDPIY